MRKHCPTLAGSLSASARVSDADLLKQTLAFYEDAEARVRSCRACSVHRPGQCAEQEYCFERGLVPSWEGSRLRLVPCEQWPEYTLRQSLAKSGVPARLVGLTVNRLRNNQAASRPLWEWISDASGEGGDAWALLHGPDQRVLTHLAIGALRLVKLTLRKGQTREPPTSYTDVRFVATALKELFDRRADSDPLEPAQHYQVAIIDGLQPAGQPRWLRQRLEEMLTDRWRRCLPTLVCTQADLAELRAAYPSVGLAFEQARWISASGITVDDG
jgi:hypothetical protein